MRPDFIYCGSCSLEFPLSELTIFIEHKRSNCSNSLAETKYDELQCSQCVRSFHTPWPLIFHFQNDHGIKLVRNLDCSEKADQTTGVLATPHLSCGQMGFQSNDHFDDILQPNTSPSQNFDDPSSKNNVPNDLTLTPFTSAVSLSSTPNVPEFSCRYSSKEVDGSAIKFSNLTYDPQACSPLHIALNLEESLRLIHRIACSKLDMHLRQMTSVDVAKTSSSYALSLCCSQTCVSCLCTVGSCSCSPTPPPTSSSQLKASASCQTDGLPDPYVIEAFTPINLLSLPENQPMELDKSPTLQDFSFLNNLNQQSFPSPSVNDPPLQSPPQQASDHHLTDKPLSPPKLLSFSCSFCGRIYRQKIHLRKHVMAQHTKQKPFFCPHCTYSTVEKSHLTVHIRTHTGERPYICRVCHYSSTQNCTLKSHYLRKHPENKISCMVCGEAYVTELEYQNHLKNCTSTLGRIV